MLNGNRRLWIFLQAAMSAGLLYWVVFRLDSGQLLQTLAGAKPLWVLAAVGALWAVLALQAARWSLFLKAASVDLAQAPSIARPLQVTAAAALMNQLLPTSLPGEALRYRWAAAQLPSLGAAGLVPTLLADRVSGLLGIALLGFGALPSLIATEKVSPLWLVLLAAMALTLVSVRFLELRWARSVLDRTLLHPAARAHLIYSLAAGSGLSFMFWLCLKAVGEAPPLAGTLVLFGGIQLVLSLPLTVSGWGAREVSVLALFSGWAQSEGSVVSASILFGLVQLLGLLPALGFFWRGLARSPAATGKVSASALLLLAGLVLNPAPARADAWSEAGFTCAAKTGAWRACQGRISSYPRDVRVFFREGAAAPARLAWQLYLHGWNSGPALSLGELVDSATYPVEAAFMGSGRPGALISLHSTGRCNEYKSHLAPEEKWRAVQGELGQLLVRAGLSSEPEPVTLSLAGHSGAYLPISQLLGHAPIREVLLLDALYGQAPAFGAWLRKSSAHRLWSVYVHQARDPEGRWYRTGTSIGNEALAQELSLPPRVAAWVSEETRLSPEELKSNRIGIFRSSGNHVSTVGIYLPGLLSNTP